MFANLPEIMFIIEDAHGATHRRPLKLACEASGFCILSVSWGASWAVLERLGPSWGRLGGNLGGILGRLGAKMGPRWGQNGPKMGQDARLEGILGRLGSMMVPRWGQDGPRGPR